MDYTVTERFVSYVKIDTQANPQSNTFPSSSKQKNLTSLLISELEAMGLECTTNDAGYVYATLPSNIDHKVSTVFFCAHIDTAPDCSGTDIKPIIHYNYQGLPIILPDDTTQVLTKEQHSNLSNKIGHDIITASGLTLLGSDDKSGIAIIMDAINQMKKDNSIPHGIVKILFTTDEEIGKGVANVDLNEIGADFGYTLDSGDLGCFENENFSADSLHIRINGVSAHPGYAKGNMENAIKIAGDIIAALPKLTLSPETTEDMEGFVHPTKIEGNLETASIDFILRDFDTAKLNHYKTIIQSIVDDVLMRYPKSSAEVTTKKQYRNMKEVLDKYPHVTQYAIEAMSNVGVTPKLGSIRGGTDGAVLSHLGLPCPNLFAGEQAIHSKHEWVSIQDMQKSVDTVIEICRLIAIKK